MIKNLGKYAHPSKMTSVKGQPITGGKKEMTPRLPMTNPANQALQAQSQISAPPMPFKNPSGPAAPTGAVMQNGPTTKQTAGLSGSKAPAHPPKQYNIKTKGLQVGVNNNPAKIRGAMTKSATKGGHSLLYGD